MLNFIMDFLHDFSLLKYIVQPGNSLNAFENYNQTNLTLLILPVKKRFVKFCGMRYRS